MKTVIKGGRVIDPASGVDKKADLFVEDGKIAALEENIEPPADAETFDASGKVTAPGFVDIHVHFRDPGQEYKEDIASGSAAAVAGGFTTVVCMPNTLPVNDTGAVSDYIARKGREAGLCRVLPAGAISRELEGKKMAEIGDMVEAGAVVITDDGHWVADSGLMRRALEYVKTFDLTVMSHCEEPSLSRGGQMHEGLVSTRLGLEGLPRAVEDAAVARDLALCELTGSKLHLTHLSSAGAVKLLRMYREAGVRVTADVTPHSLVLTDAAVEGYNTNAKMYPPLRGEKDRLALIEALADGTIDAVATDHAPHQEDEKDVEFAEAPKGVIGLETALPVLMRLVEEGKISLADLVDRLTVGPAKALGLPYGTLAPGAPADVTVFDPEAETTIDPEKFKSKSRNTPFAGWKCKGRIEGVWFEGRKVC